jgi:hypothetical protein
MELISLGLGQPRVCCSSGHLVSGTCMYIYLYCFFVVVIGLYSMNEYF